MSSTNNFSSLSPAAQSDTGSRLPDLQCAVCTQRGHGCHFGVVACRPCAAFFRRCIAENRTYKCLRGTNNCDIRRDGQRNACKACRLRICRQVGMTFGSSGGGDSGGKGTADGEEDFKSEQKTNEGQTQGTSLGRHAIGNNHLQQAYTLTSLASSSSTVPISLQSLDAPYTPVLDQLVRAHSAFVAGQRSLFMALHPEAAFQGLDILVPSHTDFVQMDNGSKPLFYQMLNDGITSFARIELSTKLTLLDEVLPRLKLLHMAHLTVEQFPDVRDTRYQGQVGHMWESARLEELLAEWAGDMEGNAAKEYVQMKAPLLRRLFRFIDLFKQFPARVTQTDFCALIAIVLWNIAYSRFDSLREDWLAHKEAVMAEWLVNLTARMDNSFASHSPALQMSRLICTLVELNAVALSLAEASTVLRIFHPVIHEKCPLEQGK